MPYLPDRNCRNRGCPNVAAKNCNGYCEHHKKVADKLYDADKDPKVLAWLKSSRYDKMRRWFLSKSKYLCVRCGRGGNILDHIKPHKGDYTLFWDQSNWQTLCKECHDKKTYSEDGGWGKKHS